MTHKDKKIHPRLRIEMKHTERMRLTHKVLIKRSQVLVVTHKVTPVKLHIAVDEYSSGGIRPQPFL